MIDPKAFAAEWVEAWNSHDLSRILSHYADDVVFTSPASSRYTGDPSGRVVGKAALEAYWRRALENAPDLTFTLRSVFSGPNAVAIRYFSSRTGAEAVEVLRFNPDGLAVDSAAYYE